ncbi:MAG: MoaD/ThiS family protein [Thermoanaerobaculia bacterium]
MITVRLPEPLRGGGNAVLNVDEPVANLAELAEVIERHIPDYRAGDELWNFAVNGNVILHGERQQALASGDEVEILMAFAGG